MKLKTITAWLDKVLDLKAFSDVSLNGLQVPRAGEDVSKVAFAVDGSVRSISAAAEAGAQLLVVHHGILWRGHVRDLPPGARRARDTAKAANVALYAAHLPLDANRAYGNNWELARYLKLKNIKPAFDYHGNVIGVIGFNAHGKKIGVCSGGAGSFAAEAQRLGCDLYVTGEADWGEKIAAENIGMPMICAGHYETETFGVKALAKAMKKALKVSTVFVSLLVGLAAFAEEEEAGFDRFYAGVSAQVLLPQGGARSRVGAAGRIGWYATEAFALEGEAADLEHTVGFAARGLWHWRGWDEYDKLFGFSRLDPFFTVGAKGWIGSSGEVGPSAGFGALWYLTDDWALRADADATLGLDGEVGVVY